MYGPIVQYLSTHGLAWLAALVPDPGQVYSLAALVLTVMFVHRARRIGINTEAALWIAAGITFGAIVGARAFYLLVSGELWTEPVSHWFSLRGTASWGAYGGGLLGAWVMAKSTKVSVPTSIDLIASCAGVAILIGRWSCVLEGDDFGVVSDVPWALRFPPGTPAYTAHLAAGLIPPGAATSLPVHPLQFYLMIPGAVTLLACTMVWRRGHARPYATFAAFLLINGVIRLPLEWFRDAAAGGAGQAVSTSQLMCVATALCGAALLMHLHRNGSHAAPAAARV